MSCWLGIMISLALASSCSSTRPIAAPARLTGDTHTHDPALIQSGDSYYVFSTGDEHGLNNGAIQVRRSRDLAYWQLVGTVFDAPPAWIGETLGTMPPNLWAPDVAFVNGTYYLYYAGSTFGSNHSVIGLATNTTLDPADPAYAWVDRGMVLESRHSDNWNAIDPAYIRDEQGNAWLAFGSFWDGIKMRRLNAANGMLDEGDTRLYALASRGGGAIEAPSIVRHGDFYYLFVSFDLCCRGVNSTYRIMVGRSAAITGPYTDRNGVAMLEGGGTKLLAGDDRLRGPGGQSVMRDGSLTRLVHH
ncbi:MAG TPA: arabinan endo-1,5-alpha-L-arabinosidase, partial [Roseiflexaceae bacterium]|nr:arabinan endo-1,5-alpha-L-arabinosidase [Roseiflexaceae bacterium]